MSLPHRRIQLWLTPTLTLLLWGCSQQPIAPSNSSLALAKLMAGTYKTLPDDPENHFVDQRIRIPAPRSTDGQPLPGQWLLLQLNTGPEQTVYRQRAMQIVAASNGQLHLHAWSFKDPKRFILGAEALPTITAQDLKPSLAEGCEQVWTQAAATWRGYVDPASCRIYSERRGARIGIEGETLLDRNGIRQTERGYDATGKRLFGTEPGTFIVMTRTSAP